MVGDILLAVVGCAVIACVVIDALWTVVWSGMGSGPLTSQLNSLIRKLMYAMAHRRRGLFSAAGPTALVAIAVTWSFLLLVGFALIAQALPDGIRAASTGRTADAMERVYFVGYTLFTLGMGDFVPHGDGARMLTVAMNAFGMFMVTLAVTYLVPVVASSVASRSFASSALSLGATPADVITAAWDGRRVDLGPQLQSLATELATLAHQHLAYPVLHLFHSADRSASAPLAVALVDETLNLLDAVDPSAAPPAPARRQLRASIQRYLETFGPHVVEAEQGPEPPSLEPLRRAGIPLVCDDAGFRTMLDDHGSHRRRMRSLLHAASVAPPTET